MKSAQIHPRPEFLRSNSSSGSPGLLLCDTLSTNERNKLLTGYEGLLAKTINTTSRCTFENSFQYLLALLDISTDQSEYTSIQSFQEQVEHAFFEWSKKHGQNATLGLLMEQFRNHRSISEKIYEALKLQIDFSA